MYQRDNVWLYSGDCVSILNALDGGVADMVVTDPPYGISFHHGNQSAGGRSSKQVKWGEIANDKDINKDWMPAIYRSLVEGGAMYLCTRWDVEPKWRDACAAAGFLLKQRLTWHKRVNGKGDLRGTYGPTCEDVLFCTKGRHILNKRPSMLLDAGCVPTWEKRFHPHQKPISLMRALIDNSSQIGDVVLDPFMGSGSTGLAAVQSGRGFIGIELNQSYYEAAVSRIDAELTRLRTGN